MTWEPTKIRWVSEVLATSTGPARVETDAGPAYAKLMGNPEGDHVLLCEWVGTRAAAWLGLPTFEVACLEVTVPELVTFPNGTVSATGPAFVARYQDGHPWGGTVEGLERVENPEVLSGLIVLDTWLLNCDRYRLRQGNLRRNTRNVFLSGQEARKGKLRLVAMDHTHVLTCGRELTRDLANISNTKDSNVYGNFPEFKRQVTSARVRLYTERLSTFTRKDAEGLLSQVPAAWEPAPDISQALVEFLDNRAKFVSETLIARLVEQDYLPRDVEVEG